MNTDLLKQYNHFSSVRSIPRQHFMAFKTVETAIRYGTKPDEIHVFRQWDVLMHRNAKLSRIDRHYNLYYQFYFLLDVIADDLVDINWRKHCVKEILIPMERISLFCPCEANNKHAQVLEKQLQATLQYANLS